MFTRRHSQESTRSVPMYDDHGRTIVHDAIHNLPKALFKHIQPQLEVVIHTGVLGMWPAQWALLLSVSILCMYRHGYGEMDKFEHR